MTGDQRGIAMPPKVWRTVLDINKQFDGPLAVAATAQYRDAAGLPPRLEVGASISWLTSLATFKLMVYLVTSMLKGEVTEFRVDMNLGSGEKVSTAWHAVALLPDAESENPPHTKL